MRSSNTVQLGIQITSDASKAASGLNDTNGLLGKVRGLAIAASAAIVGIGVAAGTYAVNAVKSAGDLEQSIGAVDTVFKGSSSVIHEWAQGAAQDVGLARNEYNELGTLIGTQLKNGGTAMDELAPKTNNLINLGADLSSMFGGDTKTAVEALSSALKGERDPIERYGVSLNQAAIDAKAAELGFEKVGSSLSAEANQAATLALIMEQTADAHGNFAKEADTLQGKQQRFAAQMENTKAIIGTALLPIATQLFGFFNEKLGPVLGDLAERFAEFTSGLDVAGWWQRLTEGVGAASGVLEYVSPLISGLIDWFKQFSPALEELVAVFSERFTLIRDIIGEFVAGVWERIEPLVPRVQGIFSTIGEIIQGAIELISAVMSAQLDMIREFWDQWGQSIIDIVGVIFEAVLGVIEPALETIKSVIGAVMALIQGDWETAWGHIVDIARGILDTIAGIFGGAKDLLVGAGRAIIDGFVGGLKSAWEGGKNFISGIGGWIAAHKGPLAYDRRLLRPAGTAIMEGLTNSLEAQLPALRTVLGKITNTIEGTSASMTAPSVTVPGSSSAGHANSRPPVIINVNGALDRLGVAHSIREILHEYDVVIGAA